MKNNIVSGYNLNEYKEEIVNLAKAKKWGNDFAWLFYGCYKELGELSIAIENKQEYKYGSEFAGIMHYILQLMHKINPHLDLDIALWKEIDRNYHRKKKTYLNGKIVRK